MDYLNFSDMCVKYSTFLDDVAARVCICSSRMPTTRSSSARTKHLKCSGAEMWSVGASRER